MKILVVDDEPFMLKILDRQLRNLGYTDVVTCERARDALAMLEADAKAVGLVFCDLQMPELDGIEFVRQLVRLRFAGGVVLVSGEEERILQSAERLAQAHRLDVIGALRKPISVEQLQQMLESNLLRSSTQPRGSAGRYGAEELRRAIVNGELVCFFQPKVKLGNGSVAGAGSIRNTAWCSPIVSSPWPRKMISSMTCRMRCCVQHCAKCANG